MSNAPALHPGIQRNLQRPLSPQELADFGAEIDAKYDRALQKIGIRPGMLSSDVGHA
mgnify:CR=1 FL=1